MKCMQFYEKIFFPSTEQKVHNLTVGIMYGLLPIDLFPKLTEETKVIWTYLLLDDEG